ncbi:hypothetical protein CCP2SC5_220015 [Azospirillaceae bacterium]
MIKIFLSVVVGLSASILLIDHINPSMVTMIYQNPWSVFGRDYIYYILIFLVGSIAFSLIVNVAIVLLFSVETRIGGRRSVVDSKAIAAIVEPIVDQAVEQAIERISHRVVAEGFSVAIVQDQIGACLIKMEERVQANILKNLAIRDTKIRSDIMDQITIRERKLKARIADVLAEKSKPASSRQSD